MSSRFASRNPTGTVYGSFCRPPRYLASLNRRDSMNEVARRWQPLFGTCARVIHDISRTEGSCPKRQMVDDLGPYLPTAVMTSASLRHSVFEQIIWLVPITVVAAGLWAPRAGLLVLVASLPFFGSPPGGPYLAALDAAALAAVALALRRGKTTPSDLDWPVAGLVLVSVASLIPITYHPPSFAPSVLIGLVRFLPDVPTWTVLYTWRALINLLIGWALYYAVRRTFDRRSMDTLGMAMGGGLALVLLLGLAEHAGLADLSSYRSLGGPFQETRLHSLFFHSGWLAEYIVLATPVAAVTLLMGGRWRRTGGIVLLTLALLTLPFTEQRGAWYAALAQITVLAFVLGPRLVKERKVLGPILAISLGVFCIGLLMVSAKPDVADPLVKRFSEATLDLSGRTNLWRTSAQLFSERPALGWGLGAFAPAYDSHLPPRINRRMALSRYRPQLVLQLWSGTRRDGPGSPFPLGYCCIIRPISHFEEHVGPRPIHGLGSPVEWCWICRQRSRPRHVLSQEHRMVVLDSPRDGISLLLVLQRLDASCRYRSDVGDLGPPTMEIVRHNHPAHGRRPQLRSTRT